MSVLTEGNTRGGSGVINNQSNSVRPKAPPPMNKREYVKGTPTKKSAGYWKNRYERLVEDNKALFNRVKELENERQNC